MKKSYDEGRKLLKAKNYKGAFDKFLEATQAPPPYALGWVRCVELLLSEDMPWDGKPNTLPANQIIEYCEYFLQSKGKGRQYDEAHVTLERLLNNNTTKVNEAHRVTWYELLAKIVEKKEGSDSPLKNIAYRMQSFYYRFENYEQLFLAFLEKQRSKGNFNEILDKLLELEKNTFKTAQKQKSQYHKNHLYHKALLISVFLHKNMGRIECRQISTSKMHFIAQCLLEKKYTCAYPEVLQCHLQLEKPLSSEILNQLIEHLTTSGKVKTKRLISFYCICAREFFERKKLTVAARILEHTFESEEALRSDYAKFHRLLKNIYKKLKKNGKLEEFNNKLLKDPARQYDYACQMDFDRRPQSIKDTEKLKEAIHYLKLAALQKHEQAMQTLRTLGSLSIDGKIIDPSKAIPEAILAVLAVLQQVGTRQPKITQADTFCYKIVDADLLTERYQNHARNAFEREYNTQRPGIYFELAHFRYQSDNKLFPNNHFIARDLFEAAIYAKDPRAYYPFARMCFYGEGGDVDIELARTFLEKTPNTAADACYLLSEIYHMHYLFDQSHPKITPTCSNEMLNKMKMLFSHAAKKGHKKAKLSLELLGQDPRFEQEEIAELIRDIPGSSSDPAPSAQMEIEPHSHEDSFSSSESEEDIFCSSESEEESDRAFDHALSELEKRNPLPMRKIAEQGDNNAVEKLIEYYNAIDNPIDYLITTLCYELNRHSMDDPVCQLLITIICDLEQNFNSFDAEQFREYIKGIETNKGTYFYECPSDDSDDEANEAYQASDYSCTADWTTTKTLVSKIAPSLKKQLASLEKKTVTDEAQYKSRIASISQAFENAARYTPDQSHSAVDAVVREELATLNYYAARDQLSEGLKITSTNFRTFRSRGLHFRTNEWSQPQRQTYRKQVRQGNHPFLGKSIYSASVYEHAGVTDYNDLLPLTSLKLEKSARFLHWQMMRLHQQPPYQGQDFKESEPDLSEKLHTDYFFHSLNHQIQQLYTNNYDGFHQLYLPFDMKQSKPIFVNQRTPMVSTAQPQADDSFTYANGGKYYKGSEHSRLRPCYNNQQKASYPYAGAVLVTFHPLSDFARSDVNEIIQLNTRGSCLIDTRIQHERETSFFSFIEEDRLKFVDIAKYPSFHHEQYLDIQFYKYGLDKADYHSFKRLIETSAPHSDQRRATMFLLGKYLAAFKLLLINHYAQTQAKKNKFVLVYPNRYGTYDLKPTYEVTPSPSGDNDRHRLRRMYTAEMRKHTIFKERNVHRNTEGEFPFSAQIRKSSLLTSLDLASPSARASFKPRRISIKIGKKRRRTKHSKEAPPEKQGKKNR